MRFGKVAIPVLAVLAVLSFLAWQPGFLPAGRPVRSGSSNELVLAMSRFDVRAGENGTQTYGAGDARVWILHPDEGWRKEVLVDRDSTAAHKGAVGDLDGDGENELYVAAGQNASLRVYEKANGSWEWEDVWNPPFIRVRDLGTGDVDSDGRDELVAATHGDGVAAVIENDGSWRITEVDRAVGIYLHEIEIADIDGDGAVEFFSNPTEPNTGIGPAQHGSIVMYRWNGSSYSRSLVEDLGDTHAKEIASGDLDGDGRDELVAALWGIAGEADAAGGGLRIETPLRIRVYRYDGGGFRGEVIAEMPDLGARALAIGDADNDGRNELVVGTGTRGLQLVRQDEGGWEREVIDRNLTGDIYGVMIIDTDRDGLNEVIANSEAMGVVNSYSWNGTGWRGETVLSGLEGYWVWAMDWGDADNE